MTRSSSGHDGFWKQRGRISLWRYPDSTKSYHGWHLNADATGCASLLELFDVLATGASPIRTIRLTPPNDAQLGVPNNRNVSWLAPDRLRIGWSDTPSDWRFTPALDPAELMFGADWLEPLKDGVAGIPKGRGDHSIGGRGKDSLPLWFWW